MIKRFYRIIFNGFLKNSSITKIRLLVLIVMFEKKNSFHLPLHCKTKTNIFSREEKKENLIIRYLIRKALTLLSSGPSMASKKFHFEPANWKKTSMSIFNVCCIFVGDLDSNHLITCIRFLILNFFFQSVWWYHKTQNKFKHCI